MNRFGKLFESKRLFAFALASLLISSLAQRYLGHIMPEPDLDFYNYYFAAQVVHDNPHANLYQGATDKNLEIYPDPPPQTVHLLHTQERLVSTSSFTLSLLFLPIFSSLSPRFRLMSPPLFGEPSTWFLCSRPSYCLPAWCACPF